MANKNSKINVQQMKANVTTIQPYTNFKILISCHSLDIRSIQEFIYTCIKKKVFKFKNHSS